MFSGSFDQEYIQGGVLGREPEAPSEIDLEGSGSNTTPAELEDDLNARLLPTWGTKAKSVVITPELDVWMWGRDNAIQSVLGWNEGQRIRDWLRSEGFTFTNDNKPERPKEAMEAVMKKLRQPRSSSLYEAIASRISLAHCDDLAFQRLCDQLRTWFPPL